MLVGYARVSTLDQNLDLQIDALQGAGCERTFTDRTSGARADRPGLREALAFARQGDVLAVWKCDRLSRSLAHLIETVQELERRGIGFRSLAEGIDTGSAGGKIVFPIFAAIASVERTLIQERTRAGLAAARQRGRIGGRPKLLMPKSWRRQQNSSVLVPRLGKSRLSSVSRFPHCIDIARHRGGRFRSKLLSAGHLSVVTHFEI